MKQILCFGDSNTWGLDGETGKRFPWEERWTGILQEKLADRDIRIVEEGLCGRTTIFEDPLRLGRRGTELLPTLLETHTPDAVVLMLGTNDCKTIFGASAEIIGKGIARLLEQINQYADKMKVLVISSKLSLITVTSTLLQTSRTLRIIAIIIIKLVIISLSLEGRLKTVV